MSNLDSIGPTTEFRAAYDQIGIVPPGDPEAEGEDRRLQISETSIGMDFAERRPEAITSVVFVVDPDQAVRESVGRLVRREGWHPETFTSAEEFLACPVDVVPSCLILDASFPGANGPELQKRVASKRPCIPTIVLSAHGDIPTSVEAMKAGAIDFLAKPFRDSEFLSAVRVALDRSRRLLAKERERRALQKCYASLSLRQRQVMALVASGLLNKQVAGELGISEVTVKAHRGQVMQKMQANSLPDLVKMATRLELSRTASFHGVAAMILSLIFLACSSKLIV